MLFPAQTSMMPVTVALARFWESHFPNLDYYPFWYLGVPFKYVGGPVIPAVLAGIHQLLPEYSLFEIYFFLIAFFWFSNGVALYFLVNALKRGLTSFWVVPIFLLGPFLPLLFPFSDGTRLIAFSFVPLALLLYWQVLRNWSVKKAILLSFWLGLILLIDNLLLPSLVLGMLALFLVMVSWRTVGRQLKRTIFVFLLAWAWATVWYTPYFWINLFSLPSFAGKGLASVTLLLTKLFSVAIPAFLALISLRSFRIRGNFLLRFTLSWLFIFGFLSLIRFLSDWDFWQDWTNYALELQMGGAILLAMLVDKILHFPLCVTRRLLLRVFLLGGVVLALALPWILAPRKFLGVRKEITGTTEYRVGQWLSENVKSDERVYLSGTTAFWLNALFDVSQVRGGADQGATHPFWAKASYEIREGQDGKAAMEWLKALGVSYLIVHDTHSEEYYHDFKYPEKFKNLVGLVKVWEEKGNVIYRLEAEWYK